jgi:hypothetical protein
MRVALLVLDGFVALTAIGGGLALVSGLERDRFSLELLDGTPFRGFLAPGLLLAVCVGGSAAVALVATAIDADAGAIASIVAGALLCGYVAVELAILNQPGWTKTEALYLAIGVLMVGLGVAVAV